MRCSMCVVPPQAKLGNGNIWLMLQRENPRAKEMNKNRKVGRMNPWPERSKQWLAYFTGRRDCTPHMHSDLQCEARHRDNLRRPSNHLPGRAVNDIQRNTNQKQSASASAFFRRTHVPSRAVAPHHWRALTRSNHACVCAAYLVHTLSYHMHTMRAWGSPRR